MVFIIKAFTTTPTIVRSESEHHRARFACHEAAARGSARRRVRGLVPQQQPAAVFDESRLAKPSDWEGLDEDTLAASMSALAGQVDETFESIKAELATEKALKAQRKTKKKAAQQDAATTEATS